MNAIGEILGINLDDQEWAERAVCAQIDPDRWFPDQGASVRDTKRVCAACPVHEECLHYALAHNERYGIWGGYTARERRHLVNGRPADRLDLERRANCRHGHLLAAVGVDANGRCRQCARDSTNRCRARRRQRLCDEMPHGRARYSYGCRCQVCTAANTAYAREYNDARRKRGAA